MKKIMQILVIGITSLLLMSCHLVSLLSNAKTEVPTPPVVQTSAAPKAEISPTSQQTSQSVPVPESAAQNVTDLDPCSLVTLTEAESILGEPANPPKNIYGACTFTNAKDSLYMVSVGAAQNKQSEGILQGQAMLLGFAGAKLDEARMEKIKKFSADLDYKGLFGELVSAAGDTVSPHAQLIDDPKSDLVYWAWIIVQPRRQGAFVAAHSQTLVNINLVVAETQSEENMLAASRSLAEKIFERLPDTFNVLIPTPESIQTEPSENPTLPSEPTLVATATLVGGFSPAATPTLVGGYSPVATPTLVGGFSPTGIPTATLVGGSPPTGLPTIVPSPTLVH